MLFPNGRTRYGIKKILALEKATIVILSDLLFLGAFGLYFISIPHIALLAALLIWLGFYSFKVHELNYLVSYTEQLLRIAVGTILGGALFQILMLFPEKAVQMALIKMMALSIIVLPIANWAITQVSLKLTKGKEYILLGSKSEYEFVVSEISQKTFGLIKVDTYLNPDLSKLGQLLPQCDGLIIGQTPMSESAYEAISKLERPGEMHYLQDMAEEILKLIPFKSMEMDQYKGRTYPNSSYTYTLVTRMVDMLVSVIVLTITLPILLLTAIAIYIEDGKPVIFKQTRVGKDGKDFTIFKFRSMRNTTLQVTKFADQEEERITAVGELIRKYRIDELPQFINVLKGEMSVVGPRPEQVEFTEEYLQTIPLYKYRLTVKPGITGWAQIMYKYSSSEEETIRKLKYDLWYIKNKSLLLNLRVMFQTLEKILFLNL